MTSNLQVPPIPQIQSVFQSSYHGGERRLVSKVQRKGNLSTRCKRKEYDMKGNWSGMKVAKVRILV